MSKNPPYELYDMDTGMVAWLRADDLTRGKARACFASEWGVDFPDVRVHVVYLRFRAADPEDFGYDTYDGPAEWWECKASDSGAIRYYHGEEIKTLKTALPAGA